MSGLARDLRESGTLVTGAEVGDTVHRHFELRLPTVQDNIDAVDEVGSTNGVALSAAILARQLTQLGTLKPEEITLDLIAALHPSDFNLMEVASATLEKKRLAAPLVAPTGAGSDLPSSAPA